MKTGKREAFRVALMFKAKGAYGRDIITGICDYTRSTRLTWDLILDEDFRSRPQSLLSWAGDGVIADFDDPLLVELLADGHIPVVGVGGSYQRDSDYPPGIPYVATDNRRLVELAYRHLIDMGLQRFALYSMPPALQPHIAGLISGFWSLMCLQISARTRRPAEPAPVPVA